MEDIVICLGRSRNRRFRKKARQASDPKLAVRYRIILNLDEGRTVSDTARALQIARSTVQRVAGRFRELGEVGLADRREDNGDRKVDEDYEATLARVVASCPTEHEWRRPTWTLEMLIETLRKQTDVQISTSTMSRALRRIGARLGQPKPTVGCPWPTDKKMRTLRAIGKLLENLPDDEVVVYEDEVDIHLNPKIGSDWMLRGQQKEVVTPGQNQKRYLAGALDFRTGQLIYVAGDRKNSLLFIHLLWELTRHFSQAKIIHVILDNYSIHSTQQVELSLTTPEGLRIQLHFLPPYCPDHNKIERLWRDLHAAVTRNHHCANMPELMHEVHIYLAENSNAVYTEVNLAA
jgi:transposase